MRRLLLATLALIVSAAGASADDFIRYYPPTAATAAGVSDPGSNGLMARTASDTSVARTISSSTLVVSNGDGVAGNPTLDIDTSVTPQFTSGTGAVSATGSIGTFYFKTDGVMYYYRNTDDPVAVAGTVAVVVPNTGTASTTALQSGDIFTNTGDTDGSELDLLNDPTVGINYSVVVTVAQTITVAPAAGETLYLNAAACANVTSATLGAALSVVAVVGGSGGKWVASGAGWTCN